MEKEREREREMDKEMDKESDYESEREKPEETMDVNNDCELENRIDQIEQKILSLIPNRNNSELDSLNEQLSKHFIMERDINNLVNNHNILQGQVSALHDLINKIANGLKLRIF